MFGRNRSAHGNYKLRLIDKEAPFSFVEAYKSLRTNVDYIVETNNLHTILITSPCPGDGKSTVSINLTVALKDSGKKVLLMDCDMRKGALSTYLKISRQTPGIIDVLAGRKELEDVIIFDQIAGIDLLPLGSRPANPAEIISSPAMIAMIQKATELYDYVILDTPSVSAVTDAVSLSRQVDGVILVARVDRTPKQSLVMSKGLLDDVNANIIGVVLSDFDAKRHSYGYDNYYYNYSYRYYAYGNETNKDDYKRRKRWFHKASKKGND